MTPAALVVMTILGCDDAVTSCHYVETVKGSWTSISACDNRSQAVLPRFTDRRYPVIVALCEKQDDGIVAQSGAGPVTAPPLPATAADMAGAAAVPPAPVSPAPAGQVDTPAGSPSTPSSVATTETTTLDQIDPAPVPPEPPGLTAIPARAYDFLRNQLPGRDTIRQALTAPVHFVGEGYSWVAHRIVPEKP